MYRGFKDRSTYIYSLLKNGNGSKLENMSDSSDEDDEINDLLTANQLPGNLLETNDYALSGNYNEIHTENILEDLESDVELLDGEEDREEIKDDNTKNLEEETDIENLILVLGNYLT
ncbi:hypothetical protein QE152_g31122 [Popillia japonica]|uniref:Uncharacterized protein n=1 Tax=Popillia japonica TaxID=7064 RepID=A0AAW1JCF5_POPJA